MKTFKQVLYLAMPVALACTYGCGKGPSAPVLGVWDSVEGDFTLEFYMLDGSTSGKSEYGSVYLYTIGKQWGTFHVPDEGKPKTHGFAGFKDKKDKEILSFSFTVEAEDKNRMVVSSIGKRPSILWKRPNGGSGDKEKVRKIGSEFAYEAERGGGVYKWQASRIEGELTGSRLVTADGTAYLIRRMGDCKEYDKEGNVVGNGIGTTVFNARGARYQCVGFVRDAKGLLFEHMLFKENLPGANVFDVVEMRPSDMRPFPSQVTLNVITQEWSGIKAGTKVTVANGGEAEITEDLASLKMRVEISNMASQAQRVGSIFKLATITGAPKGRFVIDYAVANNRSVREITLRPGEKQILEIASDMMSYTKLSQAQPLMTVHPQIENWSKDAPKLPSAEALFNPSGGSKPIQISLLRQEWRAMKAGTKVRVSEGDERAISADLAALQITVELKNLSAWSEQIGTAFLLTDDGYTPIRKFYASGSEGNSESSSEATIQLKPGEAKTLELQTGFTGFDKLTASPPARIVHSKTWEWKATPLPARDVLLKSKESP
ncbi:MAG: hypothetical protein KJ070_03045 [Verrucomicrobia bacterium]|nr:hypothetical protein [Verrucomicrobiota bacterium]